MSDQEVRVGMIGTGAIGLPIAERIASHAFTLCFYARRPETIAYLQKKRAVFVPSPERLADQCGVVLLIVNTFPQCQECLSKMLGGRALRRVVIHATISPREAEALAERCRSTGVELISAPVTGGVARAKTGELTIIAGGKRASVEELSPLFRSFGKEIVYAGGKAGSAFAMKLLVQMLVGVHTAVTAEALTLGEKWGLDPQLIYRTVCSSAGTSRIFENRAPTMMERDFTTRGTIELLCKDLNYCVEMAQSIGCETPLTTRCLQIFQAGSEALPDTKEDFSAIIKLYEKWSEIGKMNGQTL